MYIKIILSILINNLVSKLDPDPKYQVVLTVILAFLILGSSILADILLEQLLQADGVTRLFISFWEMI